MNRTEQHGLRQIPSMYGMALSGRRKIKMLQPHPHSKMVLWDYPKGRTVISMNAGETKTTLFSVLFLNGTIDTATYILYKDGTTVASGNMTSQSGCLAVTLTNLTAGDYWLDTNYTTSTNESINNTWFVIVR